MRSLKNAVSLGAILVLMSLPTFAQTIGPEIAMSPPLAAPADHSQRFPSVATDGEVFLVAWTNVVGFTRTEVFAARLSATGQLLDEISFPVATRPEDASARPQVAWTGRVFLVMYGSVGKRISRDGKVLGEVRTPPAGFMSLTCNTSRCLMVFQESTGQQLRLRGTLLDSDGEVAGADFEIARFNGLAASVTAASNGANFLIAWHLFDSNSSTERQTLYSRPVTNSGSLGESKRIAASNLELGYHDVESDGSGYLLVWIHGELSFRVQARRFNASGNPSSDVFTLHAAPRLALEPRLARWQSGYVILLMNPERGMLEAYRLRNDGSKIGSAPAASWRTPSSFEICASSQQALVVWEMAPAMTDIDIHGSFIDLASGAVSPTLVVSQSARPQYAPALARAGTSVFAVWEEHLPGKDAAISGRLVDDTSAGSSSELTDRLDQVRRPDVASKGDNVLVTWTEVSPSTRVGRAVVQAFKTSRVQPIGNSVIVGELDVVSDTKVAAGDDGFLMTWVDYQSAQLHGALLNSDGSILRRFPVSVAAAFVKPGEVSWGNSRFLVTWSEARPSPQQCDPTSCYDYAIAAALISGEGVVLKTMQISNAAGSTPPHVAWDGTRFLVTWERNLIVEAARVSIDGSAEAPRRFSTTGGGRSVVWDGTAFVGVGIRNADYLTGKSELMMTRVTHAQLDSREGGAAIQLNTIGEAIAPSITAIAPGKVAIAYQRIVYGPEYGSANRVFVRFVDTQGRRMRAIRR